MWSEYMAKWVKLGKNGLKMGVVGGILRAVHKVGTRPCPTCIVVPSTRNNEPCYAFI